jgi:purine-binding chemotaxis protein CheW
MNSAVTAAPKTRSDYVEIASFYLGDVLLGLPIDQVEEMNHHFNLTPVPQAPQCVRGVMNLRGNVVTVIDLRVILGLEPTVITRQTCNVVVSSRDEQIGILTDRVGDVVRTRWSSIEPPPANVVGSDGRYFRGVCRLDHELLILLDVEQLLAAEASAR